MKAPQRISASHPALPQCLLTHTSTAEAAQQGRGSPLLSCFLSLFQFRTTPSSFLGLRVFMIILAISLWKTLSLSVALPCWTGDCRWLEYCGQCCAFDMMARRGHTVHLFLCCCDDLSSTVKPLFPLFNQQTPSL